MTEKEESPLNSTENIVNRLCESGAHKAEITPHMKKDLGRGWAMYTCQLCNKETPMLIRKAEPEGIDEESQLSKSI